MKEKLVEIGSRIREMREHSNVTVEEMAEYLKVSVETYISCEEGSQDIPASTLFEIAPLGCHTKVKSLSTDRMNRPMLSTFSSICLS